MKRNILLIITLTAISLSLSAKDLIKIGPNFQTFGGISITYNHKDSFDLFNQLPTIDEINITVAEEDYKSIINETWNLNRKKIAGYLSKFYGTPHEIRVSEIKKTIDNLTCIQKNIIVLANKDNYDHYDKSNDFVLLEDFKGSFFWGNNWAKLYKTTTCKIILNPNN